MASTTAMPPPLRAGASNRFLRVVVNHLATAAAIGSTILVMAPLIAIFFYLLIKGASSLNVAFFTQVPKPVGELGGGMANSIWGSGILLAIASLMGVPIGIAAVSTSRSLAATSAWPTWSGSPRMCLMVCLRSLWASPFTP